MVLHAQVSWESIMLCSFPVTLNFITGDSCSGSCSTVPYPSFRMTIKFIGRKQWLETDCTSMLYWCNLFV